MNFTQLTYEVDGPLDLSALTELSALDGGAPEYPPFKGADPFPRDRSIWSSPAGPAASAFGVYA